MLINKKRLVPPSDAMVCMGIEVNAKTKALKIPDEKINELLISDEQVCHSKGITK